MKIIWFWDRFFYHFGPPKCHIKSTPNHVKSMLKPILGQDGSHKRSFIDFTSDFDWFFLILMWFCLIFSDIQMMLRITSGSTLYKLWDVFCNSIRCETICRKKHNLIHEHPAPVHTAKFQKRAANPLSMAKAVRIRVISSTVITDNTQYSNTAINIRRPLQASSVLSYGHSLQYKPPASSLQSCNLQSCNLLVIQPCNLQSCNLQPAASNPAIY